MRPAERRLSWQEALTLTAWATCTQNWTNTNRPDRHMARAAQIGRAGRFPVPDQLPCPGTGRAARMKGQCPEAACLSRESEPAWQASGSNHECGLFHLERGCQVTGGREFASAIEELKQALEYFQGLGAGSGNKLEPGLAGQQLPPWPGTGGRATVPSVCFWAPGKPDFVPVHILQVLRKARPWTGNWSQTPERSPRWLRG